MTHNTLYRSNWNFFVKHMSCHAVTKNMQSVMLQPLITNFCKAHISDKHIIRLHPEDAIRQRERIKAERIAAREQRVELVRDVQQQVDNVPDEVLEPTESECEAVFEDEDLEQEEAFEMTM